MSSGKEFPFGASPGREELFLQQVEGRAAAAGGNYFYAGSKVEPAKCWESFLCRVEGRALEPDNYRGNFSRIMESTIKNAHPPLDFLILPQVIPTSIPTPTPIPI